MSVVPPLSPLREIVSGPVVLLSVLLTAVVGCAPESRADRLETGAPPARERTAVGGPRYGGHLRVGHSLEPTSLDAVLGRSGADAYFWRQLFDQLVDADPQLAPRPETSLATSWEIGTDPDSITFQLREGVVFHDGTPFNAEAVKVNIERILDPDTLATPRASLAVVEAVEVIDEYTVRFDLARPWGAGFGMLADRGGVMSFADRDRGARPRLRLEPVRDRTVQAQGGDHRHPRAPGEERGLLGPRRAWQSASLPRRGDDPGDPRRDGPFRGPAHGGDRHRLPPPTRTCRPSSGTSAFNWKRCRAE